MRLVQGAMLALVLSAPTLGAGRPMTVDDLLAVKSVSDPQIAPDGKSVVYVVGEIDRSSGKTNTDLWLVALEGGEPKRLTTAPGTDTHPRWSPDGQTISFVSDRSGSAQVWLLPRDGGEARQLTKLPIDVSEPIWSPTGDMLAFAAEVYPGTSPEETAAKDKEKAEAKSKVRIYDHLMIRHWSSWDEGKRSHMFVCDAKTGAAKDLTPKLPVNAPPAPFGGSSDYAFSPDGKELAFTAEPIKDFAWSTNTGIWVVPVAGGEPRNFTADNPAADGQPAYSPDGQSIAYVSQKRPGFESDLWALTLRPRDGGRPLDLSSPADRPVQSFVWDRAGRALWAIIDEEGTEPIARIDARGSNRPDGRALRPDDFVKRVVTGAANHGVQATADGKTLVFVRNTADRPGELYKAGSRDGKPHRLTHHNDSLMKELDVAGAEAFQFSGADGETVGGFLIRPPGFDPQKKYPVLFLIHGGPQGAWHDEWHNRWNYGLFAAPGYALVAVNPRGSTGYGQKFTDQISLHWTGQVYDDLMKGLDHALKTYPFLDKDRVAAAGGSYGGFMVNWIAGHTDRFQALISHAGVFELEAMYGSTEELWFNEWEFGGTPWDHPKLYREQSPSAFVGNFKTPTLVLHGALDFRVPYTQGLGMFTSLQRQGVPSRFVFFPDEGHWILKPQNRVVWWHEVQEWLKSYLKP